MKSKELAEKLGVAAETISRWERGGLIQSRAMDNFLRVFFALLEVREVLRGAEQDSRFGTVAVPVNETEEYLMDRQFVITGEIVRGWDGKEWRILVHNEEALQRWWDAQGINTRREYDHRSCAMLP